MEQQSTGHESTDHDNKLVAPMNTHVYFGPASSGWGRFETALPQYWANVSAPM